MFGDGIAHPQLRPAVASVPVILPLRAEDRLAQLVTHLQAVIAHIFGDIRVIIGAAHHIPGFHFHQPVAILRHQAGIEPVPAARGGIGAAIRVVVISHFDIAQRPAGKLIVGGKAKKQLGFVVGFAKRRRLFAVGELPPGLLGIGRAEQRIIPQDAAPQREGEAQLKLHFIFTGIFGPVIAANRLFIEIAGPRVEQIVAFIRVEQKRIIMIL